jgi:hypothetical protein
MGAEMRSLGGTGGGLGRMRSERLDAEEAKECSMRDGMPGRCGGSGGAEGHWRCLGGNVMLLARVQLDAAAAAAYCVARCASTGSRHGSDGA